MQQKTKKLIAKIWLTFAGILIGSCLLAILYFVIVDIIIPNWHAVMVILAQIAFGLFILAFIGMSLWSMEQLEK